MPSLAYKARKAADLPSGYKGLTIKEYLKKILVTFWKEKPNFDGKRPFGESNPESYIDKALIEAGLVEGEIDQEYGWVDRVDSKAVDEIVLEIIRRF